VTVPSKVILDYSPTVLHFIAQWAKSIWIPDILSQDLSQTIDIAASLHHLISAKDRNDIYGCVTNEPELEIVLDLSALRSF